ncbi:hypothetical protein AB9F46_11720 [Rhizobium leguminosarum]|uniref:hypothetical protein n=1 Tax=Rhizobium TaxID=379 RepID=UPI0004064363|nr:MULTISPECIES: hypothetical protein [Rhizobium]MBY5329130.1 hypothetical protein [Rhizobium leguminosarum]MCW1410451.1 hypothetical protein [Rhizobium acaciae]MCW1742597.1 hypothetical protein [Rhizobium acaciae]
MIRFVKKSDPKPAAEDAGGESVKKVPEAAAEGPKKAANDSTPRRAPQAAEDGDPLI